MKKYILILIVLLLSMSCGKKGQTSQTKLMISSGNSAMLGAGDPMNGGIIVIGHRTDDSEQFQIGLANAYDEKVLDLKKGMWEFAAIGWTGSVVGNFTGTNKCAYTGPIDLNSPDTSIVFNMNFGECANIPNHPGVVTHPDFLHSPAAGVVNQFNTFNLYSCNTFDNTSAATASSTCTAGGLGLTGSYRVIAPGFKKGASGAGALGGLQSACMTVAIDGTSFTQIKIPVGNIVAGKKENLMNTSIQAFQSADCTGSPVSYSFNDSLYSGIDIPTSEMRAKAYSAPGFTTMSLYLQHNANTISNNLGYSIYGYGEDGDLNTFSAQVIGDYGKVVEITADPLVKTITISGTSSTGITPNDEIMWYVNSESTANACVDFRPGMFGFARVKTKAVSADTILTLDHSLREYVQNDGLTTMLNAPTPAVLAVSNCSIQIVKVPNYRNIIVPTSVAATITVYPFNFSTQIGGLFPFRVSNELRIVSSGSLLINASSKGRDVATSSLCGANTRCMKMGGGSLTSIPGGGIIFSAINRVVTEQSGTNLQFWASGMAGATGGDGGFINTKIGEIKYVGVSTLPTIYHDVSGGVTGGAAGVSYFKYCSSTAGYGLPVGSVQFCGN